MFKTVCFILTLLPLSGCGRNSVPSKANGLSFEDQLSKYWQLNYCDGDQDLTPEDLRPRETWSCMRVVVQEGEMRRQSISGVKFEMVGGRFINFTRDGHGVTERVGDANVHYGPFEKTRQGHWLKVTGKYYFEGKYPAIRHIRKGINGNLLVASATSSEPYGVGKSYDPYCRDNDFAFWDVIRCSPE